MLEAKSSIKQIEITQNKTIQVLISKQVVNGEIIISSENHRTAILPLGDVEAQMALVNNHLGSMGYPPLSKEDIASIRAQADTAWKGYVAPEEAEE